MAIDSRDSIATLPDPEVEGFRQRVCDEALRLFALEGYTGISMRRIASGCRCSPMKAYRYFASKTEILTALRKQSVAMLTARLQEAAEIDGEPMERFVRLGQAYIDFARENSARYRLLFELPREFAGDLPPVESSPPFKILVEVLRQMPNGIQGDPMANAYVVWSALHGLVLNDLVGAFESERYGFDVLWVRVQEVLARGMGMRL